MASLLTGIVSNTIAFSGASYFFSGLSHQNFKDEMKRHNRVLEDLVKGKERWYEK